MAHHSNSTNLWKLAYWLSVPAVPTLTVATLMLALKLELPFHTPFLIAAPTAGLGFSFYLAFTGRYPFSSRGWIKAGFRNWLAAMALPLACLMMFASILDTPQFPSQTGWDFVLSKVLSVAIILLFAFIGVRSGRGFNQEGKDE